VSGLVALLALVAVVACLAGQSSSARGAVPGSASAVAFGGFSVTDLGPVAEDISRYGLPMAGDDDGDVLFGGSDDPAAVYSDGGWTSAPVPSGAGSVNVYDMNDDGLVVGAARFPGNAVSNGYPYAEGYWWDPESGTTKLSTVPSECVAQFDQLTLYSVDDDREAGGGGTCLEADPEHPGGDYGDPGDYAVAYAPSPGATAQVKVLRNDNEVAHIAAINDSWEWVQGFAGQFLVNRSTQAATPITVIPQGALAAHPNALAEDGSFAGQSNGAPAVEAPDGTVTTLPAPEGYPDTGRAMGIDDAGLIAGGVTGSPAAPRIGDAVIWPSLTGTPVDLNTLLPQGSGWHLGVLGGTSEDGQYAVGAGTLNGVEHYFELHLSDLSASIALTDASGQPFTGPAEPGEQITATVTLTASASASAPITHITVDPQGLTVSPSSALTYRSGTDPSGPLSLSPGQSTSYAVTYTVAGNGRVGLSVSARGSEEGSTEEANASAVVHLSQPLGVDVSFSQNGSDLSGSRLGENTIRLADADAGEIPQDVTATVTVTNLSPSTQTHISLNGIPPLSYHVPAQATQQLPVAVTGGPSPSGALPDLAPGQSAKVTYTLHVTNNGNFDFSPQLLSSDSQGSSTYVSDGEGTLTVLPTALLWVKLSADTSRPVAPGGQVYVSGSVTDRSLTKSLVFYGLEPSTDGNLGGGGLADITDPKLPDGVVVPFAGTIRPGQTIDVGGNLATAPDAGTTGTATYDPLGAVDEGDGTRTQLTADQIGMSAGSSPITVKTDDSDPLVPPEDETLMGAFTGSAAKGMGLWALGHWQAAKELIAHPIDGAKGIGKGIAAFAVGSTRLASSAAYLTTSVYGYSVGITDLSDAERRQVEAQIVQDYQSTAIGRLVDLGEDQVRRIVDDIQAAGDTGDYAKLGSIFGTGAADTLTGVADYVLADITFQKLAQGMTVAAKGAAGAVAGSDGYLVRGIRLQTSLNDAKVAQVLGKGVAGLKPGMNLLLDNAAFLTRDFGLTTRQITELVNYCRRSDLIIAVRQRSAKAAQLIKQGLAVGKNEVIKLKAVNDVDVEYLGYSKHDLNTVVWASPVSKEYVEKQLAGAAQPVKDVVMQRYEIRVKEWKDASIRSILDKSEASGRIDWGFNGSGNGAPGADQQAFRRFALKDQPSPVAGSGRTYRQVLVGNKTGVAKNVRLVPISQDVDVMAILKASGEILPAEERAAAYTHLMDVIEMQHGETPTWIMDGEIMFQKKAKQLADVIPGGEPLAVFGPDGSVTSGFFDPGLTIFDNSTLGGRIFFKGGFNDPYSLLKAKISLAAKTFGAPTG